MASAAERNAKRMRAAAGNGAQPDHGDYIAVRLAEVDPEEVRWLWPGHLPIGKLVVLDGDPGVAKSTIALDLAARVSKGQAMPDDTRSDIFGPSNVVIMSAEDGLADTIRPRLDVAGADVSRIYALTAVVARSDNGATSERPPVLPDDIAVLETFIVATGARLVIVDVLMAYLSGETNSYRDQDVRRALAPLAAMAERRGCCVLVLRHLRKTSTGSAVYSGGGSIGIIGAARVGLMAGYDPDDDDVVDHNDRRRVLAVTKCNLARIAPSLGYRVVDEGGIGRVEWLGAVEHRADDLVSTDRERERADREAFLTDLLDSGPVAVNDVDKAAKDTGGWTLKQLRPVLKRLGGIYWRDGFQGRVYWSLPPSDSPVMPVMPISEYGKDSHHWGKTEDASGSRFCSELGCALTATDDSDLCWVHSSRHEPAHQSKESP